MLISDIKLGNDFNPSYFSIEDGLRVVSFKICFFKGGIMLPGLVECGTVIHSLNVILLQNRVVICVAQSTD